MAKRKTERCPTAALPLNHSLVSHLTQLLFSDRTRHSTLTLRTKYVISQIFPVVLHTFRQLIQWVTQSVSDCGDQWG